MGVKQGTMTGDTAGSKTEKIMHIGVVHSVAPPLCSSSHPQHPNSGFHGNTFPQPHNQPFCILSVEHLAAENHNLCTNKLALNL